MLTRKEVCYVFKRSKWWLWRCEKRGLQFVSGRVLYSALLVFLAEDDDRRFRRISQINRRIARARVRRRRRGPMRGN